MSKANTPNTSAVIAAQEPVSGNLRSKLFELANNIETEAGNHENLAHVVAILGERAGRDPDAPPLYVILHSIQTIRADVQRAADAAYSLFRKQEG